MTTEQSKPKSRKVDPRGLRPGEFGDTDTTRIPEPRPTQSERRDVARDKFGRVMPTDFVR